MSVELIPVIEFEPEKFAQKIYPYPEEHNADQLYLYWKTCLADAGIDYLMPLDKSHFVPIADIDQKALKIFLTQYLEDLVADYSPEYVGPITGGYVLREQNNILIWPQCCGDLADISEWQNALDHRFNNWQQVWIGHPCISVKFENGKLVISDTHEPGEQPQNTLLAINPLDLTQAITKAQIILKILHTKIQALLQPMFTKSQIKEIANILVYSNYDG